MQLANLCRLSMLVAATASVACGPAVSEQPDWILGTFSSGNARGATSRATRYTFYDDHRVVISVETSCGAPPTEWTMKWATGEDDTVSVQPAEGHDPYDFGFENPTFAPTGDCWRPVTLRTYRADGSVAIEGDLARGALCTERQPPCDPPGSQCDPCMLTWCDGDEPEACDP